jgi:hypothetical protein
MKARVEYLRRRRESLVAQAAMQRNEVPSIAAQLQKSLWPVDMVFAILQSIRVHPLLAVASSTLMLSDSRRKLLLWSSRLFTAWELFNLVRKQWPAAKQKKDR